jgi:hypothetical protein
MAELLPFLKRVLLRLKNSLLTLWDQIISRAIRHQRRTTGHLSGFQSLQTSLRLK